MFSIYTLVREFHHLMGIPILNYPQVPENDRVKLRLRLMTEEYCETMEAALGEGALSHIKKLINEHIESADVKVDMVSFIDGLVDQDYINEGTRLEFGVFGAPVLFEVHTANMAKAGGGLRQDGKVLKPEGWKPPDVAGVLKQQGWGR